MKFFVLMYGYYSGVVSNQEQVMLARIQYAISKWNFQFQITMVCKSYLAAPPLKQKLVESCRRPTLVANLYAYNPLMRLFRHFFQ